MEHQPSPGVTSLYMSDHPRILHLSCEPHFRGGERQLLWLHEGFLKRGFDSTLLFQKKSGLSEKKAGKAEPHALTTFINLFGIIAFIYQVKKLSPTIIHCHDSKAFTFGYMASRLLGIALLFTRRTVFPIRPTFFNKLKYNHAQSIVAISQAVAAYCKPIITKKDSLSIIPDGVKLPQQALSQEECRAALGFPKEAIIIGSVAYFTREKNISLIFQLAQSLNKAFPNVNIACVGQLPPSIKKEAQAHPNILLTDVVEHVERLYPAFDLYISTSTKEGLGSALLDAMIRDIPVVAMDSGGARDLFLKGSPLLIPQDENNTFIQRVHDWLENRAIHREHIKELGVYTRNHFAIDRVVEQYVELYNK